MSMDLPPLDPAVQRRHKLRNVGQALLLSGAMVAMLAFSAWLIAGATGILTVAVAAGVTLALRPKVPAGWVLRMYGARPLPVAAAPELHRLVAVLAQRADLPAPPRLYYVPTSMLNAFAVGRREDAAIGVTDGLLRRLTGREVAGVLAHEISHVRSDDLWVMTLADMVGRLTHALAYAGLLLLIVGLPFLAAGSAWPAVTALALTLVPTVVTLLQLALSRSREYDADFEAARLTGDPAGLASALVRLERHEGRIWERILVPHGRTPDPALLRTHPPTSERVRRLQSLTPSAGAWVTLPDVHRPPDGYARVMRPPRLRSPGVRW